MRHTCVGLIDDDNNVLDYIAGRKIYIEGYLTSDIRNNQQYKELQEYLKSGQSVTLIEVDGPKNVTEITAETLTFARNSTKLPFGHGWVIGAMLLNLQDTI